MIGSCRVRLPAKGFEWSSSSATARGFENPASSAAAGIRIELTAAGIGIHDLDRVDECFVGSIYY
jgi:hypothetical protein